MTVFKGIHTGRIKSDQPNIQQLPKDDTLWQIDECKPVDLTWRPSNVFGDVESNMVGLGKCTAYPDGIDEYDAYPDGEMVEISEEFSQVKCECGADTVGSGGHSPWCPKA